MTEFDLIAHITRSLPTNQSVVVGPGDDCAALNLGIPDSLILFKTDAVVEGVHFLPDADPQRIGHKALGRCLSDIAAMGGAPAHALITLGLPAGFKIEFVDTVYSGICRLASQYNVAVVGGETTLSAAHIFLSITVMGSVRKDRCIRRSGAQVGDAILVTGTLGGSLAGKHFDFEPRLSEAQWLTAHFGIHAMIDVSDGLSGDLRHLVTASRVGAEILGSAIPISQAARQAARVSNNGNQKSSGQSSAPKSPLMAALTDGEDFELLFTVSSSDAVPLLDAWKKQFPDVSLSCIGKIVSDSGIRLKDTKGIRTLAESGYVHFA